MSENIIEDMIKLEEKRTPNDSKKVAQESSMDSYKLERKTKLQNKLQCI